MVFRVTPGDRQANRARCQALAQTLGRRFPDYAAALGSGVPPMEADLRLVESGVISENELLDLYCDALHLPPFDEKLYDQPRPLDGMNGAYLASHVLLPLRMEEGRLYVAVASPYRLEEESYALESLTGCEVWFELARRGTLERLIQHLYLAPQDSSAPAEDGGNGTGDIENENELRRLAGETGIVKLVNELLMQALELGASDIHIEPEENEVVARFRVDGIIGDYQKLPLADYPAIASRIKLVGGLNIAERRLPQDGRTNFRLGDRNLDIRISTIPIMNGESIVLRLLDKESTRFSLRELGMEPGQLEAFEKLIRLPHGILLVVGPTGSGKTTTLYSVMHKLNDRHHKIITIEDPVEYQLPGLSQMQVNAKIGLTFADGLRHIVRQDPDVILVGEIRDRETADIAVNAALTGHLVLSTLHTNDAVGAIVRLLDMKVEPFLITATLCGVLSQRLVRRSCRECGGVGHIGASGTRCRVCGGSGFRGRTGIFELLVFDDELRAAVHRGADSAELTAIARKNGMKTLFESGMKKVERGETSRSELLRAASAGGSGTEEGGG